MRIRSDKTIGAINNGIAMRQDFQAASVSGEYLTYTPSHTWMSAEERDRLAHDIAMSPTGKVFAVFSYGTPIAWTLPDGSWSVTEKKYSPSTTHHTSLVRNAIFLSSDRS